MRRLVGLVFGLALLIGATPDRSLAQVSSAVVVAACGSKTYTAGTSQAQTQDTTGKQCGGAVVSGTVGATQSGVWTVQPGNTANTTAWKVDGSAVTQPVSGTVTSNQGGVWTVQPGNTANTTAWKVDGSAVTQPVSGTVTSNQGGVWTVQPGNTANTTAWKVDGSAVTQPVSAASLPLPTSASTAPNQTAPQAPVTAATATATTSILGGCRYVSTLDTFTNSQQGAITCNARGSLNTNIVDANGTALSLGAANASGQSTATGLIVGRSQGSWFNGSTWDPQRSIIDGNNSVGTGIGAAGIVGQCDDSSIVALTENQFGNVRISCTNHSVVVRPFETASNSWQVSVSISDTTNTTLHASCGAGLKNYVTALDYSSVATTVADELDLNDNTTPIWKTNIGAGAAGRAYEWLTPKVGTAATSMNAQFTGSPTGAVIVNASGYCAP